MGFRILLVLLTVCVVAFAQESKTPRPQIKWKPIIGFVETSTKAFYDENSMEKTITENGEYSSGAVLISSKQPKEIELLGKKHQIKSMVRHLVVDCGSRIMMPVMDYFFEIEHPTRLNLPVGGFEYEASPEFAVKLPKDSPIYATFCPIYI